MLRLIIFGASLVVLAAAEPWDKSDGKCGYECTQDHECGGCGTSPKCSCPNGLDVKFFETSCTCVSAPSVAPNAPPKEVGDSVWPQQWTANFEAINYEDWAHTTTTGKGKFYYDAVRGRTRTDWTPYWHGKDAKQVWIGSTSDERSTYYVKVGPLCVSFPITDAGQGGSVIGIEKPEWMKKCSDAGFATYIGREQVHVDNEDVWVDHWSCRLDNVGVNHSITFQNWHSLGLNKVPKGLPLRVTGGNSGPNPTLGLPRLSTSWYKDFDVGSWATHDNDFEKPNFGIFCIPVGKEESEAFFGHVVEPSHVFSADFHRRAHSFPLATPSAGDLKRAKQAKPSRAFTGDSFSETMQKLNGILSREKGLNTKSCSNFSLPELHEMQRILFDARAPELDKVYQQVSDTRLMVHESVDSLQKEQRSQAALDPELIAKARDGTCHEMVMWYIHHLTADARADIKDRLVLPLLPIVQHMAPAEAAHDATHNLHKRYTEQVSCAVCHVTKSGEGLVISV